MREVIRPFLTAEIRLVSEAGIGNSEHLHFVPGEKSAFEEQSGRPMIPWLLARVCWRISSHQVSQFHTRIVTCSHRMKAEACIALQPRLVPRAGQSGFHQRDHAGRSQRGVQQIGVSTQASHGGEQAVGGTALERDGEAWSLVERTWVTT